MSTNDQDQAAKPVIRADETAPFAQSPPHSLKSTQVMTLKPSDNQELRNAFVDLLLDVTTLPDSHEFQVVRRLGRGRQGVVFEATRQGYLDCVTRHAIKMFDPSIFSDTGTYLAEMRRIARQTGRLQQLYHPNLVQCDAFCAYKGIGILVMQLIDGLDLRSLLDATAHRAVRDQVSEEDWTYFNHVIFAPERHRIQPGIAVYILRKVLRALEALHSIGYIHCDIKPSNIMIDGNGSVRVIDFGRAAEVSEPGDYFVGSPMYMAPELHERRNLTPVVDIYSAGMVVLELLHGDYLIDPRSSEDELHRFKQSLPERLPAYLPADVSRNEELTHILRRLIAVDPAQRYSTAAQAESGDEGAFLIHQQLARANLDVDYGRELRRYVRVRLGSAPAP